MSPIRFLFLKLPPPPCAVLLEYTYTGHNNNAANPNIQAIETVSLPFKIRERSARLGEIVCPDPLCEK